MAKEPQQLPIDPIERAGQQAEQQILGPLLASPHHLELSTEEEQVIRKYAGIVAGLARQEAQALFSGNAEQQVCARLNHLASQTTNPAEQRAIAAAKRATEEAVTSYVNWVDRTLRSDWIHNHPEEDRLDVALGHHYVAADLVEEGSSDYTERVLRALGVNEQDLASGWLQRIVKEKGVNARIYTDTPGSGLQEEIPTAIPGVVVSIHYDGDPSPNVVSSLSAQVDRLGRPHYDLLKPGWIVYMRWYSAANHPAYHARKAAE